MENGSPGDFLNPFTVCSACNLKFVVCQFFKKKQTEVIGLLRDQNGLTGLVHLCIYSRRGTGIIRARGIIRAANFRH
jgi:hypothetical protein